MKRVKFWFNGREKKRYINGGKGVISIFLALLMIPFILQADVLIEVSRYHAAVSALEEIMDLAANSTLSQYDSYLMDRFGLTAVGQQSDIKTTYASYLNSNLKGSKIAWNTNSVSVDGLYALNDIDVLEHEITELAKYSVPTEIAGNLLVSNIKTVLDKISGSGGKTLVAYEKAAGGIATAVGSLADVVTGYEELKDALETLESSKSDYTAKYGVFETKTNELAAALREVASKQQAKNAADQAKANADSACAGIDAQIQQTQNQLDELKTQLEEEQITEDEYDESIKPLEEQLDSLKAQKKSAESSQTSANQAVNTANSELNAAKNLVQSKKNEVNNASNAYADAILNLMSALADSKAKSENLLTKLSSAATSCANASKEISNVKTTVSNGNNAAKADELAAENKRLEQLRDEQTNAADAQEIQEQIDYNSYLINNYEHDTTYNDVQNNVNNMVTVFDQGTQGLVDILKSGLNSYNAATVDDCIAKLNTLYSVISRFSADTVTSSFVCTKSVYYVTISGYAKASEIDDALAQADEQVSDDDDAETNSDKIGFWALLKGLSKTMNGLFKINVFYNSGLDAVIKPELLGNENNGLSKIINGLCNMASDMAEIAEKDFGKKSLIKKLKKLVDLYNDGKEILSGLSTYTTELISNAVSVCNELVSGAYDKVLISKFLNLSCANRCTYTGKDVLTGYSFSNAGLSATRNNEDAVFVVGAFSALKNAVQSNRAGNASMFCGAETEYLLCGSRNEIANQVAVFLNIYFVRLALDIAPIMSNAEVSGIVNAVGAATAGIGGLLVEIFYYLIEPFIDTLVLVNGTEIDVFKQCVYLTPSGLPTLLSRLTSLKLNDSQVDEVMAQAAAAMHQNYSYGGKATKDAGSFLKMDYTDYLFILLLFQSNETSLKRFQNLITLESKKKNSEFDLGKTYTYISAEVNGEYVPFLSAAAIYTNLAFSKQRTQVRGY